MKKVEHFLSAVIAGRFSSVCRNGQPFQIEMPSRRCLVPIPEGVERIRLDRERIACCKSGRRA